MISERFPLFSFERIQAGNQTLNGRENVLQILRVLPGWRHGRSSDRRVRGGNQHVMDVGNTESLGSVPVVNSER